MREKVRRFEDLDVWKEGMRLASKVYQELKDCQDFGLWDQMQRAAISIPLNIAHPCLLVDCHDSGLTPTPQLCSRINE